MKRERVFWWFVLISSVLLLIGYSIWGFSNMRYGRTGPFGYGYYGRGMMNRWFNLYNKPFDNNKDRLSINQIRNNVDKYIKYYDDNLEIADIFVFKDSDYYVSIEEKDTGKGAMELLVNPYTGDIYPEYGPNMMWNEKYGMHGQRGFGMMGMMMGGASWNRGNWYYNDQNNLKKVDREDAIKIADKYVKNSEGKDFSVVAEGHEFYGYYTFHVNKGNKTVGMLSVNYYTGDVWYHTWHGQLEKIISHDEK
ncbi:MAG: hypothetical protein PWR27_168 [Petroclostridium sp.]|jgi:hypothetical protein|uniref:hypothetical protein n=1 Tax=Petroclostridium xylanilyticum TaxID=1792311 RepID=UPI000B98E3A8|nr:hypothetical protein [Petroclostridium xylanilyticum]MBZ4646626.1 hypothetical protein [Clostridia bacterium]MDK2809459.1 hypothetical protein [Petroclostridium sp.]